MEKRIPRGVRNNNPLNIRYNTGNYWVDQTGSYGQFYKFSSPKYGFRAAVKILLKYAGKDKITTISDIINKWAPGSDGNDTKAYIATVCNAMHMQPVDTINVQDWQTVTRLLFSMAVVECTATALKEAHIGVYDCIEGYYLAIKNYEKG